jgi:WD40 repeat protein
MDCKFVKTRPGQNLLPIIEDAD